MKLKSKEPLFCGKNRKEERKALGAYYYAMGGKEQVCGEDLKMSDRRVKKALEKIEAGKRLGSAEQRIQGMNDEMRAEKVDNFLLRCM
jgi:hypothetical protein